MRTKLANGKYAEKSSYEDRLELENVWIDKWGADKLHYTREEAVALARFLADAGYLEEPCFHCKVLTKSAVIARLCKTCDEECAIEVVASASSLGEADDH